MNLMNLSWRCEVCRRERLDKDIKVYKRNFNFKNDKELPAGSMGRAGSMDRNIKYCADNPKCLIGAMQLMDDFEERITSNLGGKK